MNKNKWLCKICGRNFEKVKGLSAHINFSHKISSKEYYNKYLKTKGEDICENEKCFNKTTWVSITRGYNRFCCDICGNTSLVRRLEEQKRMLRLYKDNPSLKLQRSEDNKKYWADKINRDKASQYTKNLWKDKEIRKCMLKSQRKTWKSEEYRNKKRQIALEIAKDPQWRKNVSEGTIKGWNKVPEKKEQQRQYMIDGGAAHCNRFIKNPSKPQIELFEICQGLLPYPILNYPCGRYSIDIAVPSLNLAIEYDGTYWHQDEEYDKKRQEYIEKEGWLFLRYINEVPDENKIMIDIERIIKWDSSAI